MRGLSRLTGATRLYWPLLPLCLGVFIAADDQTVVVTVLPELLIDLEVGVYDLDRASWTITGYLIGFTAAMPLMGRISDRLGFRRAFIAALALFAGGSALVAISPAIPSLLGASGPNLWVTVGARVIQAIGGGATIPIAIASVGDLLPRCRHPVAFGLIGASAEAGGVIGPLWGGIFTHFLSWEWVFWVNLPLGGAVIALMRLTPAGTARPVRIDLVGALLFGGALALLTVALTEAGKFGWIHGMALVGFAMATAFMVRRQRGSADPLIPRRLFRSLSFLHANLGHLMVGAALIIGMVTVPLMANTVLGASPLEGGLRLLRLTAAIPPGAILGGVITQRWGGRGAALPGLILVAAGFLLMSSWDLEIADPWMTLHLAAAGFGFGLLIAPITTAALGSAGPEERGAASSMVTVSRMVGMTIGLAAITAWGTTRFDHLVAGAPALISDPAVQQALTDTAIDAGLTVFRGFFLAAAAVAIAAIAPAWLMTRRAR